MYNVELLLILIFLTFLKMQLQRVKSADEDSRAVGTYQAVLTVSQLIAYFEASLPKPNNYPRIARSYVEYCLENKFGIDLISLNLYGAGKKGNLISPVRKFLKFYQLQQQPHIVADPPVTGKISPAANELILGYLNEAVHLRGDQSRENYTKALNAFFEYMESEVQAGRPASFSVLTVGQYVNFLRTKNLSAFTVNFYLSIIKQLTNWVIKNRSRLELSSEQVENLHEIAGIRGLKIERGFYKESLSENERDELLATIEEVADRAIVALLGIQGLRTVEVCRLLAGDVDLERKQLWVLGKGKHTRKVIKLFDSCAESLRLYIAGKNITQNTPLFPDLKTAQIRYRVDKYLKALGLKRPKVSAHSLRHTVGQLLIEQGVEPVHVQRHLRHEMFETTQFYIRKQTEKEYLKKMPD